jgi:Subtilase family
LTGDFDPAIEGHGTLTASNVVGQGVINGKAPQFNDLKTPGHVLPGMVLGGAPDAKLTPFGDIYFSFDFSTQFGYFLTGRYGVQVTSNSYGTSTSDNDGMDAASQEADVITSTFGDRTTPVFSTGNGAPGFGTVTAPSPTLGIQVGAATQFGGTGWDSIKNLSQVTDNEVIEWSNRGSGADGRNGTDVVADGSYSDGDSTLNTIVDGRNAWVTWGGTSRSTPVTVGAIADIQQAYKQAHGTFATGETIKSILKSAAKDLGYESYIQGAGSVDAGKAVQAALGTHASIAPNEWRPAADPAAASQTFAQTVAPGATASQSFDLSRPGNWTVSDRVLRKVSTESFPFTSQSVSQESVSNITRPTT